MVNNWRNYYYNHIIGLFIFNKFRRFALNYEQTAKCGGEQLFMEDFKKTKGYRYCVSKS